MERWRGRVALVTGASSGIGAAVCENLVKNELKVVGIARRIEKMQDLYEKLKTEKGTFLPIKCDITKDEDIYSLFDQIKEKFGGVDICVNNAGICGTGLGLLDGTTEEWRQMYNVNVIAICLCSKLTVKSLQERNLDDGHIINISSIAGHCVQNVRELHFYTATKFSLKALSEGLRQELQSINSGIKLSVISPGLVKTEILRDISLDSSFNKNIMELNTSLKPEDIAQTVSQILAAPSYMEVLDMLVVPRGKPMVDGKGRSMDMK
ncbi:Farnesol dehydrogenase [Armadillidium nasatum]|uniref:Farnesol dehydrogenase n=1 Tax=Armadillidium nasatum TaxID=96803 RepID=A0A5N5SHB2_9CRUS|nr:Farnesol dehydrogenase [Armadillidium nasatum]